jgi:hypothetical protein
VRRALIFTVLLLWVVAGWYSAHATRRSQALRTNIPEVATLSSTAQENAHPPAILTFTGAIAKNGDTYVLNESKTHKLYELAARFSAKTVTITGTLDTIKNVIHIQSIAEAQA